MTEQELKEKIIQLFGKHAVAFPYRSECMKFVDELMPLVKQANYVRLADDQRLPNKIKYGGNQISDAFNSGYLEAQQDMLDDKYREVELI